MGVLEKISNGELTVKWNGWTFGGGRDWGDWHYFTLYQNRKEYGYLGLGTNNLSVEIDKEGYSMELTDEKRDEAYATLLLAVQRDDSELMSKLKGNELPCGYDDISRDDVLYGIWKGE